MTSLPELIALGQYLAGEFDNREQALAEPAWYVHLRLWQIPIPLFSEDSITLFAEQASIVKLDQPYRQRIMRLTSGYNHDTPLKVQYYMPKDPAALRGAGHNPSLLQTLTPDKLDLLPGCVLNISQEILAPNQYKFTAIAPANTRCCFNYAGNTIQVSLGFEVSQQELKTYDKGIDPNTGSATWGAIMGPYRYTKREQY
ncbi:chorismate mutase [Mastigocladus laminosus UU774]|nr:chorismate mutase [Mastigocladus laminosus UU774]